MTIEKIDCTDCYILVLDNDHNLYKFYITEHQHNFRPVKIDVCVEPLPNGFRTKAANKH